MAQDGKTEKPTARRLRDARKEGQFARTPDAATWLGIAAGTALVPHGLGVLRDEVGRMLATLPDVAADPTPARCSRPRVGAAVGRAHRRGTRRARGRRGRRPRPRPCRACTRRRRH